MGCRHKRGGIDTYSVRLIHIKVNQLIGKYGFNEADRDDLEQDLSIDLIQRMQHYDTSKSKTTTFAARVVKHRIATLVESRKAQCRDWRLKTSLNSPIELDGDECEVLDLVSSEGTVKRHSQEPLEFQNTDLRLDLTDAIQKLSPELQDLCLLLKTHTISEIVKQTGIPRSTIYCRLRDIREVFEKIGFDDYLESTESNYFR